MTTLLAVHMETEAAEAELKEMALSIGRKFETTDIQAMKHDVRTRVYMYALNYKGTFDFMIEMSKAAHKGALSVGQLKAVANCIRVEVLRNQKPTIVGRSSAPSFEVSTTVKHVIPNGYYTIKMIDGHVTIRISNASSSKRANDVGNMKGDQGEQVASMLVGPNNEGDYRGQCFINGNKIRVQFSGASTKGLAAVDFLLGNPERGNEFGMLFARESGNCFKCGRLLTDPESIELGIGPVCRNN